MFLFYGQELLEVQHQFQSIFRDAGAIHLVVGIEFLRVCIGRELAGQADPRFRNRRTMAQMRPEFSAISSSEASRSPAWEREISSSSRVIVCAGACAAYVQLYPYPV